MALYNQYYGNYIVGGLVLVLLAVLVSRILGSGGASATGGEGLSRDDRKQLKAFQSEGNFSAAADLLFASGSYEEAAELYQKAEIFIRAGEAWEKVGNTSRAVQMYKRSGNNDMAAQVFVKRGQFALAAREYEAMENLDRAAENYYKAGDYRTAGRLYRQQDRFKEAGQAYEKIGEKKKAAVMFRQYFKIQHGMVRGDIQRIKEACELAARAAEFLEADGEQLEAAELFQKAGFLKRAAALYTKLGKVDEAAAIYIEAGKPLYAAKLYDSVGEQRKALKYRAEARLMKDDAAGAAADFSAAGDHARAAELFMQAELPVKAAESFAKAGDYRSAADIFRTQGIRDKAALCFEKAGDYDSAAELYRLLNDPKSEIRVAKAGRDFLRVGEILFRHEREEDALAAFQRVEMGSPGFAKACELQGDILRKLGSLDIAFGKYRDALGDARPSKGNVSILFKMAQTAEEAGSLHQALTLYEAVMGVDYYYEDASEKAADMKKRVGSDQGPSNVMGLTGALSAAPGQLRSETEQSAAASRTSVSGRYEIIDEIARGGMGVVYRALDSVLDRTVAFKILAANLKENDVAVKYFLREAKAAAKMQHPNIVQVYDAGEQDGEYYMAMEYVEGQTLKALVNRQGAFPEKLVRYIGVHVCRGLSYAHGQGLVHRDIKPGNLMLTKERTVKIMDFGLAKFVDEVQQNHTRAIGTPYYMSPEQIVGEELDGRSDIYSLGVSLFECATGVVPFSKGDLSYHHLHTEPPYAQEINPEISNELSDIILRCMAKKPNERFNNVHDVMEVIRS